MRRPKKPKNLIGIDQFSQFLYGAERNLLPPERRRKKKGKKSNMKDNYANEPDKQKKYMREWRKENRNHINDYYNDWCSRNPDKKSMINRKYRLKKFLDGEVE